MYIAEGIEANRRLWEAWTKGHQRSEFYDVETFAAGKSSLAEIEIAGVGDVEGKSLLHLQCHFGLDTLDWARRGATVTGVDFSQSAIDLAQALSQRLNLPARFICSEIGRIAPLEDEQFDVVFTSYGVLSWLPDLTVWAATIARHLKPGGFFYMAEFHPVLGMLDDDGEEIAYSYFGEPEPIVTEETTSYGGAQHEPLACYQWGHSLSDVFESLTAAGLTIESLHEFPFSPHQCYGFLVEYAPGRYVAQRYPGKLPLIFSIKARR